MDLPETFQPSEPFVIFQSLLDDLPKLLNKARHLRTTNVADPISLKAALVGFGLFHPMQAWSRANFEYIDSHLNGEVPPDNFSPTPDCDEAIRAFASLGLGASLGQFNAGHIDDDQATKNEWYLFAFINVHGQQICERYRAAEQSWDSGSS